MSKNKLAVKFHNLHQLWQFAQAIKATTIEIKTGECLLVCNCSEEDLRLIHQYNGKVLEKVLS